MRTYSIRRLAQMIVAHRTGRNPRQATHRHPGLLMPVIESALDCNQVAFAGGLLSDIQARGLQRGHYILRQDKAVLTDPAQKPQGALPAQARPVLFKVRHQTDLIGDRPLRNKSPETAPLPRCILHKKHIVLKRLDFLPIAHHAAITGVSLPLLW